MFKQMAGFRSHTTAAAGKNLELTATPLFMAVSVDTRNTTLPFYKVKAATKKPKPLTFNLQYSWLAIGFLEKNVFGLH